MLYQVLREIETAQGPITVRELSHKLGIEPNAIEGMIQFWVRKGRIQEDDTAMFCDEDSRNCNTCCSGSTNCAFIAKMPKTYSISAADVSQKPIENND